MAAASAVVQLLHAGRFCAAAEVAESSLRSAAAESPELLIETARGIVAWKGFFAYSNDAAASIRYFRSVFVVLEELAGPASGAAMAAADNLASMLGSGDRVDEAIALRERVWDYVRGRFAVDDPQYMEVRAGLAFLYRRAGTEARAAELYRHTGICEHLLSLEEWLRAQGAYPYSCGRPWSRACHIWTCFDAVLDCARLISLLQIDACVRIHEHRGTHDGSEMGLFCTVHEDAVIGRHPGDAGAGVRRLPG